MLSIDMVIHSGIFDINKITLFPCFTFISKTGVSFYCVRPYISNELYESFPSMGLHLSLI